MNETLNQFRLIPPQASTVGVEVDRLFLFELLVSVVMTLGIAGAIIYAAVRYRRRSDDEVPGPTKDHTWLEISWSVLPFGVMLIMFFWGAAVYAFAKRPHVNALEIHIIGKQWMWKAQHMEGIREINALHVPANRPVRLVMTSQDVIHDFSIPAFRIKQDVIPGSYVTQWFEATTPGEYHLFCSQYCGTLHSEMVGVVVVMTEQKYQDWLAGHLSDEPPAASGAKIFATYGCASCHGQRAPTLAGLYLSDVQLDNGKRTVADENYLRESIIYPSAKIVLGYPAIMPSYRGQLSEEQLFDLIEYIKSLSAARSPEKGNADEGAPAATRPYYPLPPSQLPNQPPAHESVQGIR